MFNTKEQEIIKFGLENRKSKEEIQKAITNYRLGIGSIDVSPPKKETFLQDAGSDISQIGTEVAKSTDVRIDKTQEIMKKYAAGEQGKARSVFQLAGQGAGWTSDIIGSVFKGIVKAALPQRTETAIKGGIEKATAPIVESETVKKILTKYNSLDPKTKKDVDAAIGFVSLGADIAGAAVGTKLVKQGVKTGVKATKAVIKTGSKIIGKTAKVVSGTKDYAISRLPKLFGIFSGENDDIIRYALANPKAAEQGLRAGDVALRKVVEEGSLKSIQLRSAFIKGYSLAKNKVLGKYSKVIVKKTEVKKIFTDILKENKVRIKSGKLDFATSKIVANPGEVSKVRNAWKALDKWDALLTIDSLDEYKQLVGRLTRFATEAGVPSKSPILGRFYHELGTVAKTKLPKNIASEYIKLNKKFSGGIELYDDMVKAFNSGDPFTRFANAMGSNRDTLRQVLDFYEKQSGKSALSVVAGRALAAEKQAAFGFLNPRSWVDFFISPELQGKIILKTGKYLPKR